MPLLPPLADRSTRLELLDDPASWPEGVVDNLAELTWTNRWFGGLSSLRTHLRPLLRLDDARLLDVGTGSGSTLQDLGRWARGRGANWNLVGLDLHADLLGVSHPAERTFTPCAGDATRLPFADDAFDAAISLQTLHHFDDASAAVVIREMIRVARQLVVVSDLRRGVLPYLGARGLATFVWKNPLTRHDGPLSVQRGFTTAELSCLGADAGSQRHVATRYGPFRVVLVCQTE